MTLERFRLAAALPPERGWHLELVLDASVAPAQPVVLARVPAGITGDALALTALMRDVEKAVRVAHPALLPVRGLADAGGLAVVCDWREGEPLEAVLEAGGPLAPALAARVVLGLAEALQAAHAGGAVHGDVRAGRVLVCEDGAVQLTGLGWSGVTGATVQADLAGLAGVATACLGASQEQGEAAAVVAASLRPTAAEVVEALQRLAPVPLAEVAARLEAALPTERAARTARRLALARARMPVPIGGPGAERPALSPPPLPSGLRAVAVPGAPAAAATASAPASVSPPGPAVAAARPRSEAAAPPRPPPAPPAPGPAAPPPPAASAPPAGRLFAPGLPLVVGAAMAVVGLLVGAWLGR